MITFNPFDPALRIDPYPIYKALREQDPVNWTPFLQSWVLTRYDDVLAVLKDHGTFSSERLRSTNPLMLQMESYRLGAGPLGTAPTMLSLDPPAHTRMRNLANKAFTPRVIEQIRPRIEAIANELLDALPDPVCIELMEDLAVPLPVIVIAEVLGVPASDRERFKTWSTDIANSLVGPFQPAQALERSQRSANEIADYFRNAIAARRRAPREDLLSAMIAAEEQGDFLSEDELVATCILLLVAGNETTTNLLGNGILALLRHPDQLRLLQEQPDLVPAAIDEMLRYDGSVQMTSRVLTEDFEMRGKHMEAGQIVLVGVGAANHDPEQFGQPDEFDITRAQNHNLAFGHGIHYCIGMPLALAEAQTAVSTLLTRFPNLRADFEAPEWGQSFILRGLKNLKLSNR